MWCQIPAGMTGISAVLAGCFLRLGHIAMESKASGRVGCADDADGIGRKGIGRKGERGDEEDDDGVTFLGPPSLPTADQKLNSQGLYLDTRLARTSIGREADDDENADGCQRQIAPVTVVFDLPDGSQADQKVSHAECLVVEHNFIPDALGVVLIRAALGKLGSPYPLHPERQEIFECMSSCDMFHPTRSLARLAQFQLGQTVEVLKSYVESEFGIPMSCQELYLGSTLMMDPMSLLDYPGVDGKGDVFIVVEGDMAEEAKK